LNTNTIKLLKFKTCIFISTQIHGSLKKKTFEAAGVTLPRVTNQPVAQPSPLQNKSPSPQQAVVVVQQQPQMINKSTAEVTLNMLNAENEVDVEGLHFEGANEVVSS
jgi:hypothetical protein